MPFVNLYLSNNTQTQLRIHIEPGHKANQVLKLICKAFGRPENTIETVEVAVADDSWVYIDPESTDLSYIDKVINESYQTSVNESTDQIKYRLRLSFNEQAQQVNGSQPSGSAYLLDGTNNVVSGYQLLETKLIDVAIKEKSKFESIVANPEFPKHVYNWGTYHEAYEMFYQKPDICSLLGKLYPKAIVRLYDITSHSDVVSTFRALLYEIFYNGLMRDMFTIEVEPTNTAAHPDLSCRLKDGCRIFFVAEANLAFDLNPDIINDEDIKNKSRQNNEIVSQFENSYVYQSKACLKGVVANLVQLFTYVKNLSVKYGILSNYFNTWIVKVENDTMYVSKCITKDNLLPHLFFALMTAYDCERSQVSKIPIAPRQGSKMTVLTAIIRDIDLGLYNPIGEGRSGLVFKASLNDEEIAIKITDTIKCGEEILSEMLNEAKIYKRLRNRAVNIVPKLIYAGYIGIYYVIATQYVQGVHIEFERMNKKQQDLCLNCLREFHSLGLVHGDIRAPNLIYCAKPSHFKIIDLGYSKFCKDKYDLTEEEESLQSEFIRDKDDPNESLSKDDSFS